MLGQTSVCLPLKLSNMPTTNPCPRQAETLRVPVGCGGGEITTGPVGMRRRTGHFLSARLCEPCVSALSFSQTTHHSLPTIHSSPPNISFAPRRDGGRLHNWNRGGKK
jgi:hypothetical protein